MNPIEQKDIKKKKKKNLQTEDKKLKKKNLLKFLKLFSTCRLLDINTKTIA
jgi:hypothetical protein